MFNLRAHFRRSDLFRTFLFTVTTTFCGSTVVADPLPVAEIKRSSPVSFQQEILPILQSSCLACHSATERQGDLVLESPAAILKGGDTGPAVVPGDAEKSLLLRVAAHREDPVMPPEDNEVAAKNLTASELGLLQLWINQGAQGTGGMQTLSPRSWKSLPENFRPVLALSVSPDGQYLASSRGNQIVLHHVPSGQLVTTMVDSTLSASSESPEIAHRDLVQSLAFNRDGDLLASGGFREVKLWRRPRDVQRWNAELAVRPHAIAISPDRKLIATNGPDHSIQLRHADSGNVSAVLSGHSDTVTGLRFSQSGQHVVSSSLDNTVLIHHLADSRVIAKIETPAAVNDVELVTVQAATAELKYPAVQIVTAEADNVVRVWSAGNQPLSDTTNEDVQLLQEIKGHSQPVTCLASISLRPKEVLTGSKDGTVRWWRTYDGGQIRQFNHGGAVTDVAATADGQTFSSAGENNSARLWRSNGQQIAELKGDLRRNSSVAKARQQLNSANSRVNVAKRQTDEAESDLPRKKEAEQKLTESLATMNQAVEEKKNALKKATEEKRNAERKAIELAAEVRMLQAKKDVAQQYANEASLRLKRHQTKATQLQQAINAAPDNPELKKLLEETQQDIAMAQEDAQKKSAAVQEPVRELQDALARSGKAAQLVESVQKPFNDAEAALKQALDAQNLTAQQHALAATETKQAAERIPVRQQAFVAAQNAQKLAQEALTEAENAARTAEQPVSSVVFSADGTTLFTAGALGIVHSWDAATGSAVSSWEGHGGPVHAVLPIDHLTLLSCGADQTLRLWEVNPGWQLERTIGAADDPDLLSHRVTSLDFSFDSQRLLVSSGVPSRQGEWRIFDVATGQLVQKCSDAHDDVIYAARFSPDASRIASVGADRFLRLFDAHTGNLLRRMEGHTDYVLSVSWKSDGQTLATAAADNSVKVWDVETGDQKRTIANFKKHVTDIGFSGDTEDVFCVSGDHSVRMVRTSNGGTIRNFAGTAAWIHCADLANDGRLAAAGDASGRVVVWDTTNGRQLLDVK